MRVSDRRAWCNAGDAAVEKEVSRLFEPPDEGVGRVAMEPVENHVEVCFR